MEECHVRSISSNIDTYNSCLYTCIISGRYDRMMARQHSYETTPQVVYTHPEMFDANGQLVPDEIVALRIENHHDTDEDSLEED